MASGDEVKDLVEGVEGMMMIAKSPAYELIAIFQGFGMSGARSGSGNGALSGREYLFP